MNLNVRLISIDYNFNIVVSFGQNLLVLIICLNLAQRSSLKSDHHHELFNQHMSQSLVLIGPGGGAWVPLSGFNDPFGHRVDTEAILNG